MPQPSAARGREQQEHNSESGWSTEIRIRLALAVAVLVAVPALWSVEPVRRVLRESFTRMPSPYVELYFPRTPAIDGLTVKMTIALVQHGTTEASDQKLKIWLARPDGTVTRSTIITIHSRPEVPAEATVRLPLAARSSVVNVALLGHTQTLHYRLYIPVILRPKDARP